MTPHLHHTGGVIESIDLCASKKRKQGEYVSAMVPDPYKILGLTHDASANEIKKAYRKLAMELHPDRLTRIGASQEEVYRATCQFAAVSTAYALLTDPSRKRQYDHVYKYGGYDEVATTPTLGETRTAASSTTTGVRPPKPSQRGIGYTFVDPISYVLSQGKVKSQAVAGVYIPSRLNMAHSPDGGFQVSFSSGQAKETDTGSVHCRSTTMLFSRGKKSSKVETTKIHRDGRKEVVIEGDDYIERRFSTAPPRNRQSRAAEPTVPEEEEECRDDDHLAGKTEDIPWHAQFLKDLKDMTSNLQKCTNPSLCGAIVAR